MAIDAMKVGGRAEVAQAAATLVLAEAIIDGLDSVADAIKGLDESMMKVADAISTRAD
jgi:hypothetical protein